MARTAKTKALAVPKPADLAEVVQTPEYRALVEECDAIINQTSFDYKMRMVEGMHELGQRIVTDKLWKKFAHGNRDFVKKLAVAVHRSSSEIYYAVNFYERFETIKAAVSEIPEGGKELTWAGVKKFLTSPQNKAKCDHSEGTTTMVVTLKKCIDCGVVVDKQTTTK